MVRFLCTLFWVFFLCRVRTHVGSCSPNRSSYAVYALQIAAAALCGELLNVHAFSGVGYQRRRWTLARCLKLLRELEAIARGEGGATTPADKRKAARTAVLAATVWAFFRPHTDGHQRIRERVTVAAAVRKAASLERAVLADAERSDDPAFKEVAEELNAVLRSEYDFKLPTAPGLRFCTKGKAVERGFLAWPCSQTRPTSPRWQCHVRHARRSPSRRLLRRRPCSSSPTRR